MSDTDQDLQSARVAIFTTTGCKYCKLSKETLKLMKVEYADIDVSASPQLRSGLQDHTGIRTVPQVFIDGKFIGGSSELVELVNKGELLNMLNAATQPALPAELLEIVKEARQQLKANERAATTVSKETQALQLLAEKMAAGIPKHEWSRGLLRKQRFPNTFTGADTVAWLRSNAADQAASNEQALSLAQRLMEAHLMYDVLDAPGTSRPQFRPSTDAHYRLRADTPPPQSGEALNKRYIWYGEARPATAVANELRGRILALYDKHVSKDGKAVSYKGIARDPLWQEYVDAAAELQRVDISGLSREQLLAVFINTYNALIIHALVVYGTPANLLDRLGLYARNAKYTIGGIDYSADEMEHGVMRGNKVAPSSLGALLKLPFLQKPCFPENDPRRSKVVSPMDPRIHFALNCGAKSCPPIKLYTPETLEEGLQGAAETFLQNEVDVDAAGRKVTLTMILKWYGDDFGRNNRERLQSILPYLSGEKKEALAKLLEDGNGDIAVEFRPYDWDLNDGDE